MLEFRETKNISKQDLLVLYTDAQWTAYTKDLDKLYRAIQNSNSVISVWEKDKLVGLVRTIGDQETICYIQDILILKEYKRRGIGKKLIEKILEKSKEIRQIVLLTDAQDMDVRKFYESLNFASCDDGSTVAFKLK